MRTTLIIPGLRNSGPAHWQSYWEQYDPTARRVQQANWEEPDLAKWSANVANAIRSATGEVWLVAHSFGCLASVQAAASLPEQVAGALLVAPASPSKFGLREILPRAPLPFPACVVASGNDPWMSFKEAWEWARLWGGQFIALGAVGHINAESGFGPWPEGKRLLAELRNTRQQQRQQTRDEQGNHLYGRRLAGRFSMTALREV